MARHDIKNKPTLGDKFKNVVPFKKNNSPIVIPRDKLEAAHLKVKIATDQNKKLKNIIIGLIVTNLLAIAWGIYG